MTQDMAGKLNTIGLTKNAKTKLLQAGGRGQAPEGGPGSRGRPQQLPRG